MAALAVPLRGRMFPVGATVTAHHVSAHATGGPPSGAPLVAPATVELTPKDVADISWLPRHVVTLVGLDQLPIPPSNLVLYALVAGEHRYAHVTTGY